MNTLAGTPEGGDRRLGGVVVLGGAHGTLALSRSLGARGVRVCIISNDTPLPGLSRHVRKRITWPGPDDGRAVDFLLAAATTHGLERHLLIPAGDAEVRLVAQAADRLSPTYSLAMPPWEQLRKVCEKPLLYCLADGLGLAVPRTYRFRSTEEAARASLGFPVVLKPSMGGNSRFARAKVVRADDRRSLLNAFEAAAADVEPENVVVQELIPGGGENQFSYAALWDRGKPVAEFMARRTRQFPVDFGFTSTFVEIVDEPRIAEAARSVLGTIGYHGLVEMEFKRDKRDGRDKVLDVNARPWSWFGLAAAAGIDLGAMLWALENGEKVEPAAARPDTSWMYMARDIVAAGKLIATRQLTTTSYMKSLSGIRAWAAYSADDPLPALLDMPVTAWRVLTRRLLHFN